MDTTTYNSLLALLAYMKEDEKEHWQASGYPDNHIYHHVRRLEAWASDYKPS